MAATQTPSNDDHTVRSSVLESPPNMKPTPIDVDKPQWNQAQFTGRMKRFLAITNPLLIFRTKEDLEKVRILIEGARIGYVPKETTVRDLYAAKVVYDSSFHPDTGEKMFLPGRMSFQLPGCTAIIVGMLAFYRTPIQVTLAQLVNQSFNAGVNYTNNSRSKESPVTLKQTLSAFVLATTSAVTVAVWMNRLAQRQTRPLMARLVPLVAVAAANCVNIPLMRQQELIHGTEIKDEQGNKLGMSKIAAAWGITQVCISRIFIASPSMLIVPVIMHKLEKSAFIRYGLWYTLGLPTLLSGLILALTIPMGCALFPQQSSLHIKHLESALQQNINGGYGLRHDRVYFNKGL